MVPLGAVVMLITCLGGPLVLVTILKVRVKGKVLAWILEEDKTISTRLLPRQGDFVIFGEDHFLIDEQYTRTLWYPSNFPTFLQNQVPVLLLESGRAQPLDWNNLQKKGVSPKELTDVLDPIWLGHLIKGASGTTEVTKANKMLPWLTMGVAAISMILLFVLFTKVGSLTDAVSSLKEAVSNIQDVIN